MYSIYTDSEMCTLFNHIENPAAYAEALDMWYDDIMTLNAPAPEVIFHANSVLDYWGQDACITDVKYSSVKQCCIWTVCDGLMGRNDYTE